MAIHSLLTITSVPFCAATVLARILPWRKIRFRNIPAVVYVADVLLAPLMMLGAAGKITHWWDWTPISRREVDCAVDPLVVTSRAPQQRIYKTSRWLGQYNWQGVKDLYKTLFVLQVVAVLEPEWYQGFWRLMISGNRFQDENQYKIYDQVDVLVRGKVKTLLDGTKAFLGQAEDGRYIPLKLVAITSREKYPNVPFV
jgi:hypothetical protein